MNWPEDFFAFRDWVLDTSGAPQKAIWIVAIALAGFVLGAVFAFIFRRTARRFAHLEKDGDRQVIDILSGFIRIVFLVASAAWAADILGWLSLEASWALARNGAIALAIIIGAWFLSTWASARIRSFGRKAGQISSQANVALFDFLSSVFRWIALAVALIFALQQFGFQTASLIAVVGAAGLAIALALQDTLKAVAAGVMIAVARPFRLGDFARIAGEEGTVDSITPFNTVLRTPDNREVVVPNDKAWSDVVINATARERRQVDLIFSVSYSDDLDHALDVLVRTVAADPRVITDPPIWAKVHALAESSVDLRLRAWCLTSDWLDLRGDVLKTVKQAFDREGISIPFPHQVSINKGEIWERLAESTSQGGRPLLGRDSDRGGDEGGQ